MRTKLTLLALGLLTAIVISSCGPRVVVPGPRHAFVTTVTGRVVHAGHGVPGARVRIEGYSAGDVTNSRGDFIIRLTTSAPAGVHRMRVNVTAGKSGFYNRTVPITIRDGGSTSVRISLTRR